MRGRRRIAALTAVVVGAVVAGWAVSDLASIDDLDAAFADRAGAEGAVDDGFTVVGIEAPRPGTAQELVDPDGGLSDQGLAQLVDGLLERGATLVVFAEVVLADGGGERLGAAANGRPVLVPRMEAVAAADAVASGDAPVFTPRLAPGLPGLSAAQQRFHAIVPTVAEGDDVRVLPLRVAAAGGEAGPLTFVALAVGAAALRDSTPETWAAAIDGASFGTTGFTMGTVTVPDEGAGTLRLTPASDLTSLVPGTTVRSVRPRVAYVAADEVLAGSADADVVTGRVVLVGTTDVRRARFVPVPGAGEVGVPEVWVQALALNTVLSGNYLQPASDLAVGATILLAALLGVGLLSLRRVGSGAWLAVAVAAGWLLLAFSMVRSGTVPEVVGPVATLAIAGAATFVLRYVTELRHRREVSALFSKYVPAAVAAELVADPERAAQAAAGERAEVTVFFCDLRGFTRMAAGLEPPQVREILEVYYRHLGDLVLEHGGTLMQYVGDEVFAVFGTPLPLDDHADRAVACAVAAQAAADGIAEELAADGIGRIDYGIGLQSGEVVAAHVGQRAARRQYAVVGDTVNVGARLCSQAGAGEVVISEDVLGRLREPPHVEPLGAVQMKGVERELALYRLATT